jgi:hypothetical protein
VAACLAGALLLGYAVYGLPDLQTQNFSLRSAKPEDEKKPDAGTLVGLQAQIDQLMAQRATPKPLANDNPELLALQAQVRQLREQIAALQAIQQTQVKPPANVDLPSPPGAARPATSEADAPPKLTAGKTKKIKEKPVEPVEPDQTAAVLSRLRQSSPSPNAARPIQETPAVSTPSAPVAAPQWLALANAAVADGRLDDARRRLQEVQLSLMFRQTEQDIASTVALALAALNNNNRVQTQAYITQAINQITKNTKEPESSGVQRR